MTSTSALSVEARKALNAYLAANYGDLSDIEGFAQTMFNAGGRAMLETTKEFSGMEARLARLEQQVADVLAIWRMVAPESSR